MTFTLGVETYNEQSAQYRPPVPSEIFPDGRVAGFSTEIGLAWFPTPMRKWKR
ncbi:MAG: hypothetical protein ABI183_05050 [Polyangiaceae bacterium]